MFFPKVLSFIKSHYIFETIYLLLSLLVIAFLLFEKYYKTEIPIENKPISMVVENLTEAKLVSLEKDYNTLLLKINQLEQKNEELIVLFKKIEKKQQNQQDFLKRLCEYVQVITVDKKIIPRQCAPEFNWNNE